MNSESFSRLMYKQPVVNPNNESPKEQTTNAHTTGMTLNSIMRSDVN